MESIYNLDFQNTSLENKIVIGFDRISQVFKTLLIEESQQYNLSPIQIQFLIFINYHSENRSTISYLAK
jgi:DNA-binding MarR family transcriptional regulator